jgi:hypothetical protein
MKMYLFNTETGIYLREDLAKEAPMGRGAFALPAAAATIAPPLVEYGEMLVFNSAAQRWYIRRRPEKRG